MAIHAADWKPAEGPLMTRWAKDVSPETVHPEYPRPQMVRENWTNLNGLWDYAVVTEASGDVGRASGLPEKWDGQILVPFPIESALSGVMKRVQPTDKLIYHRTFKAQDLKDGRRLLLHFGAVDWQCEVSVNGKKVGDHTGGYDPFTLDITDALDKSKSEQELIVSVNDPADANWQPRGKQVQNPRGIWYTPTTGIWQTVWLEEVPNVAIESFAIVPDFDAAPVSITVKHAEARNARSTIVARSRRRSREVRFQSSHLLGP
jgi:beta-galactosidase/beta-glucuronidase